MVGEGAVGAKGPGLTGPGRARAARCPQSWDSIPCWPGLSTGAPSPWCVPGHLRLLTALTLGPVPRGAASWGQLVGTVLGPLCRFLQPPPPRGRRVSISEAGGKLVSGNTGLKTPSVEEGQKGLSAAHLSQP